MKTPACLLMIFPLEKALEDVVVTFVRSNVTAGKRCGLVGTIPQRERFCSWLERAIVHSCRDRGIAAWSASGRPLPKDNAHMVCCIIIGQRDMRATCERYAVEFNR